jgi:capsular polysaccharide transport system permease protein
LYLERIVQPGLPDRAMEPRRARNIAATFLLGLIIWGVSSLTVAAVKEHQD